MEWHWTEIGKVKALWNGSLLQLRTELRRKSHHYTGTHITGRSISSVIATKLLSLAFNALPSQTLILLSILISPLRPFIRGQTELFLFSIFHLVSLSQCLSSCCPVASNVLALNSIDPNPCLPLPPPSRSPSDWPQREITSPAFPFQYLFCTSLMAFLTL